MISIFNGDAEGQNGLLTRVASFQRASATRHHIQSFPSSVERGFPNAQMTYLPQTRPTHLRNVICLYCGGEICAENRSKNHVIGRKFVPKGMLENRWNLLLNACRGYNNRKSDLEDDIAAITMLRGLLGRRSLSHPGLADEAAAKARSSHSRRTGKPVADSRETMDIKFDLGGGAILTFNMVSPPQIDEARAFELARLHFTAFFYFITYNRETERGWWWPGHYAPIQVVGRGSKRLG